MTSRYWRTMGTNFLVGVVIEYAICLLISIYFNDANHLFSALLIMLGMWAVQLVLWAKNLAASTAHYYLMTKRAWIAEIEVALRQHNFPIYSGSMPDAVEYLASIVRDQNSNVDQIAFAAASLGQIELLKPMKPTAAWRLMSVIESALDNYRQSPYAARS